MDQLQSLMNNWILLAQGLIGSIGALALASGELPRTPGLAAKIRPSGSRTQRSGEGRLGLSGDDLSHRPATKSGRRFRARFRDAGES